MLEPMLCKSIPNIPNKADNLIIEKKQDGWRCIYEDGALFTRTGKAITSVPYLVRALSVLPQGTILDGEIVSTGDTEWNQVQEVCSRDREHRITEDNPALKLVLFDVIKLDDVQLKQETLAVRREFLEKCGEILTSQNVEIIQQLACTQDNYDKIVADGGEGVVIKDISSVYSPGSRGWFKVKHFEEIEAVCTGTYSTDAGTKYAGKAVGGITFKWTYEGKLLNGKCAGNINDSLRKELYDNPEKFVGKIVEIKHYGINSTGKLRMPQYLRFRDGADKAPPVAVRASQQVVLRPAAKRKRNYEAMGDAKLYKVLWQLQNGGDAAEKSEDVPRDLALVEQLVRNKE